MSVIEETRCCGNCEKFKFEDAFGRGICIDGAEPDIANCAEPACCFWYEALPYDECESRFYPQPLKRERTPVGDYRCPNCNAAFVENAGLTPFCGNCGQALDLTGVIPCQTE